MTGSRITHYEVLHKVGQGAMGVVHQCRRLIQETRTVAKLNRPDIVTLRLAEHKKWYGRAQVVAQLGSLGNLRCGLLDHFELRKVAELFLHQCGTEAR